MKNIGLIIGSIVLVGGGIGVWFYLKKRKAAQADDEEIQKVLDDAAKVLEQTGGDSLGTGSTETVKVGTVTVSAEQVRIAAMAKGSEYATVLRQWETVNAKPITTGFMGYTEFKKRIELKPIQARLDNIKQQLATLGYQFSGTGTNWTIQKI